MTTYVFILRLNRSSENVGGWPSCVEAFAVVPLQCFDPLKSQNLAMPLGWIQLGSKLLQGHGSYNRPAGIMSWNI